MKIRLNKDMRLELTKYAEGLISFPEDEAAIEELYKIAQGAAREAIQQRYPLNDMLILQRYDQARQRDSYRFSLDAFNQIQFQFKPETGPLACSTGWSNPPISCPNGYRKIEDHYKAVKALGLKKNQLLSDYKNLIASARTLEELIEVWPEAEVMRDSLEGRAGRRAISCLSSEAIERIKADVAQRSIA